MFTICKNFASNSNYQRCQIETEHPEKATNGQKVISGRAKRDMQLDRFSDIFAW